MDDLINKQDFDKFLKSAEEEAMKKRKYVFANALNTIRGNLRDFPSAQPERKGKWIFKNDLRQFFCSECGVPSLTYDDVYLYSMNLPNFCEDCGADMRKEGDE